jgi:hypothetical protein
VELDAPKAKRAINVDRRYFIIKYDGSEVIWSKVCSGGLEYQKHKVFICMKGAGSKEEVAWHALHFGRLKAQNCHARRLGTLVHPYIPHLNLKIRHNSRRAIVS